MFLITGPSHLANLVVAIDSLRLHWNGPVLVYAFPESYQIAKQICEDTCTAATVIECDATYRKKNAQEIAKIALIQTIKDYDEIVYLDADLIIQKPIEPLFAAAASSPVGFAATQFCDWMMSQGVPTARVSRLLQFAEIPSLCVHMALRPTQVSYNSGIFATRVDSPVLPEWGHWTEISKNIYISGETALHAIAQKYSIATLRHGVYNCSPKYQSRIVSDGDVGIWHFHGDCNTRPKKSERGVAMWLDYFTRVLAANVGGVNDWKRKIGNEYLNALLDSKGIA